MFLVNSRLGLFSATQIRFHRKGGHRPGHPFSRSYGVNLPSSLTRVIPLALGFSPCLPVSVCGTGTRNLARGFSWQCGIGQFATKLRSPSRLRLIDAGDLPPASPYPLGRTSNCPLCLPFCVTPSLKRSRGGTGISTCCPSPTPFGLGLGPDLP